MSNGFSIAPGNIPGNLTVGGQLTVNGGLLKCAVGTYFVRFGQLDSGNTGISWNKKTEFNGQDDPTLAAFYQGFDTATGRCGGEILQPGSADQQWHRAGALQTSNNSVTATGTGVTTLYNVTLRKSIFGVSRPARVRIVVLGTMDTSAGSGIALTLSLPLATPQGILGIAGGHASAQFRLEMDFFTDQFGTTLSCHWLGMVRMSPEQVTNAFVSFAGANLAVDNNLLITAQGVAAGDTITTVLMQAFEYNTH